MKPSRKLGRIQTLALAGLVFVISSVARAEGRRCLVETYHMPMADWVKIPATLRDNHSELHRKFKDAARTGKYPLGDRIGGHYADRPVSFRAENLMRYPESFTTNGRMIMPDQWVHRDVGSRLEIAPRNEGEISCPGLVYSWSPPPSGVSPIVGDGEADDKKRTGLPVFESIHLRTNMGSAADVPTLLGVAPVPRHAGKPDDVMVIFGHGLGMVVGKKTDSIFRVEVLVLRGAPGGVADPSARIRSLLVQKDGLETAVVLAVKEADKASVESRCEWMFPTGAELRGQVVLPKDIETLAVGTTVECQAPGPDGNEFQMAITHALSKPALPLALAEGGGTISPSAIPEHQMKSKSRFKALLGSWQLLEEIPLESIFGKAKITPKNQSCHVFVRVTRDTPRSSDSR